VVLTLGCIIVLGNNLVSGKEIKDSLDVTVTKFILQKWMQKEYKNIKITEEDVKNFYKKNRDKIKTPDKIEIAKINYKKKNKHAIKALKEIRASKDIEKAFKDRISYPRWVDSASLPSEMKKIIAKLKVGEMTKDYVELNGSFYLFYLKAKKDGEQLSYEQAKSSLVNHTKQDNLRVKVDKLYKKLRKNAQITYDKKTKLPTVNGFKWTYTFYEKYFLDSDKRDWEEGYNWHFTANAFGKLSKKKKEARLKDMIQSSLLLENIKKEKSFQKELKRVPVLNMKNQLKIRLWKVNLKSSTIPTVFEELACLNDDSIPQSSKRNCMKQNVYKKYLKDTMYYLRKQSYIKLFLDTEYKKVANVKKLTLKDDSEKIKRCSALSMDETTNEAARFIVIEAECRDFLLKDMRKFCKKVSKKNKMEDNDHLDIFCANYTSSYKQKY
jgi:peptidylprolyl isomerase